MSRSFIILVLNILLVLLICEAGVCGGWWSKNKETYNLKSYEDEIRETEYIACSKSEYEILQALVALGNRVLLLEKKNKSPCKE